MRKTLAFAFLLLLGCPNGDSIPPTVTIVAPLAGDTVAGVVGVRAVATDNDRVDRVELVVDDTLRATGETGTGDTFAFEFDTGTLAPDTHHAFVCVAFDAVGSSDSSAPVNVFVRTGTLHSGTVSDDETWDPEGNPHLVQGELVVRATLTVRPGVVVRMLEDALVSVGRNSSGRLLAEGTADSGVVFTSATGVPGDWRGIRVAAGNRADTSRFAYCTFEYGGRDGQAMLAARGSPVVVRSCTLRHAAGSGLGVSDSGLAECSRSRFDDCQEYPVVVDPASVTALGTGNAFSDNGTRGIGVTRGTLVADARWEDFGLPYYVSGSVDVADSSNPVLTIAPGCSLLFADSAALRIGVGIGGALWADGGAGPIVFGSYPSTPGPRSWPGIEFLPGADPFQSTLLNCRIEYAGGNGAAALVCYIPLTMVGNAVIGSAASGVSFLGTGPSLFTGNVITGCSGYPVEIGAADVGWLGANNQLSGNVLDSIKVTAGAVRYDAQWRDHGVPYLVSGGVSIGSVNAPDVTIDRGTVLAFGIHGWLTVGDSGPGALIALGSEDDSIVFTGATAQPGAWRGIELRDETKTSTVLEYCRVLYGGRNGQGIVYINSCAPRVVRNEIGWSTNYCVVLLYSPLDPDTLRDRNWLHDWNPEYDDIFWDN